MEIKMTTTDTPRTDAVTLVKCYCPRCIVGVHNDIQLVAQYRKHAETEAKVERLNGQLKRAIEIADEFWNNQKQAVLMHHQELARELEQLKELEKSKSEIL